MAVAPKVSLRYWQKCLEAHRKHLLQQINGQQWNSSANLDHKVDPLEEYVEYSILAGDIDQAVEVLDNNKQTQAARTIRFVDLAGGFHKNSVQDRHEPA
jgi:hypothetical protein